MDAVAEGVVKRKVSLVIVTTDISEKSKENIEYVCTINKVPVIEFSTMEILGKVIGKKSRAIIGIKDKVFSEAITCKMNLLKDETKNNGGDLL